MRTKHLVPALVAAALLAASACSDDTPGGAGDGRPGSDVELAHAQCMRDHGIDYPDPELVEGDWQPRVGADLDLESAAYKTAERECAAIRDGAEPAAGEVDDPADRAQLEEEMDRMLAFAACMRGEGLDFPDPQFDDEGGISGAAGPVDGDVEAFEAARDVCEDQIGEG